MGSLDASSILPAGRQVQRLATGIKERNAIIKSIRPADWFSILNF